MMRIVLVRHGRSSHVASSWLDRPALVTWFERYDAAGLAPGDAPPAPLHELAERAGLIVTSDLRRAVESAALLADGRPVAASALLRETPLAIPSVGRMRLPMTAWAVLIGARWALRARSDSATADTAARVRSREAAAWLAGLARDQGPLIVAVTHGVFRRYVADALEALGWERTPSRRRWRSWSAWEFRRPD